MNNHKYSFVTLTRALGWYPCRPFWGSKRPVVRLPAGNRSGGAVVPQAKVTVTKTLRPTRVVMPLPVMKVNFTYLNCRAALYKITVEAPRL